MDSKLLHGAPLSATMAAPKVPVPSSTGIRAPLTLDDSDFEYSVSTSGKKYGTFSSSSSDSEFQSDGSVSGEDEFEMASKMPFVSGPDVGILEETHFVKKYVVTRPLVKNPNEEFIQESSSVRAFDDSRPLLYDSNEEVVEDNDNLEGYADSRPFVVDSDDGTLGAPVEESKNASVIESPVLDTGIAVLPKQGMPIAQLSWDSDDDFVWSETFEDESFSGTARVPDSGFQERLSNGPKIRVLEVEEVEDSASQTENLSEAEILEDSIVEGGDNVVVNSSSEGNHVVLEELVCDPVSAEVIEDKDPIINKQVEGGDLDEGTKEPDPTNLTFEETNYSNMLGISGTQVVEHILPCELLETEVIEVEAAENFEAASTDNESNRNQNLNANGTAVLSRRDDNEKLMNEVEQNEVKSHDCDALNNTESVDGAMVMDMVGSMNHAELSETKVAQRSECFEKGHFSDITESLVMEDELHSEPNISQALHQYSNLEPETTSEIENDSIPIKEEENLLQYHATESLNFGGSERVNSTDQLEEHMSSDSLSCGESPENRSQVFDAMTGTDSNDEPNIHEDLQEEEVSDSSAFAAPLRASSGVRLEGGNDTFMSADGTRLISLEQQAGLGSTVHSLGPAIQLNNDILFGPPKLMANGESNAILSEKEKKKLEKLQQIRIKYLRLLHRLKQSPEDSVAAKVLYQLLLASGRPSALEFSFDFAKQAAMELEAQGKNNLDFSLNILIVGKSGVGKSATINSIFGENKAITSAFESATTVLREVKGTIDGVQVQVLDTPGLRSSLMEQSTNRKILLSIKKFMKKFLPDIVLYVDRLDLQTGDLNDLPLLKSITSYLGSSLWSRTILTLTHAASTPPEGPSGNALSYELFVAQRSRAVRKLISHSVGDPHVIKPSLIPVSLVENYSICEINKSDHILPQDEESWRSKLLLLCYSVKILSEIDSTVQPKDALDRKFFGFNIRSLPLPYFLSSLLQSNAHPKLSTTQGGKDVDSDTQLAFSSDCDPESEDEYDELPAFKPLRKSQIAKLDKEQRKAYSEEYDYRVKLLQKKQLKEEVRRFRDVKKKQKEGAKNYAGVEDLDQEMESPGALAVRLPDMVLPPSFDGDSPAYRYRFLEPSSQILRRPVLGFHGWDHDCGYDGVNIEDNLAIAGQIPAVITVQLTKDKGEFNIHLNSSVAAKHGEKGSTMAGLDIQIIGEQLAYTLKTESKMKISKVNKSAAGISITFFGGNVITGLKVEDRIAVGKNLILVGTTGLSRCQNDAAYGANLAIRLKDKDYPIEQDQHLVGLSIMRWRGDNVLGLNLQSQFSVGRNSKLGVRAGLNSRKSGEISVRINSSGDLHSAIMLGLIPIAKTIIRSLFAQIGER